MYCEKSGKKKFTTLQESVQPIVLLEDRKHRKCDAPARAREPIVYGKQTVATERTTVSLSGGGFFLSTVNQRSELVRLETEGRID